VATPPIAETPANPASPTRKFAFAAEQVGQPAAQQQQATEGEAVGGHHPLPVGGGEPQGRLRRGQRDVHDRRVERDHQLGEGDEA
jgi:hypothetical protein